MAIKKRIAIEQNLDQVNTFIVDEGNISTYFNITDLPEELPMGRSSMLFMGSRFLKENVVIKIELKDNVGNPIYIEPVFGYKESQGIRVSIEVYDTTAAGSATLTVLGEIDPAKAPELELPDEAIGVYNVKYTKQVIINKEIANVRPIRFRLRPRMIVSEIVKGQITQLSTSTGSFSQSAGTITGIPAPNTEANSFNIDDPQYGEGVSYTDQIYGFSPIGNTNPYEIPETKYTFSISSAEFTASMVGGTLTVTNPVANPGFTTQDYHNTQVSYSGKITEVLNKNTVEVQIPYGIYNSASANYQISAMDPSSYSIVWPKPSEFTSSSINFKSFADIRLLDMRTYSGDVYRVAGYVKNNGPFGNWSKIIDTPVESPELLIDETSMTGTSRIGFFRSDSVVNTYWETSGSTSGNTPSQQVQTASDPEFLPNSLFVSASGTNSLASTDDQWIQLKLKPQYAMEFQTGTDYSLSVDLICDNRSGSLDTTKAVFHLSGSAFAMSSANPTYGRAIGMKMFENAAGQLRGNGTPGSTETRFNSVFTPDNNGTATLQIRFVGGHWHMANLSIRPNTDTNFSPEFIRLIAPVPKLQTRPDNLDFAFEFYDINNNKSETVITSMTQFPDGIQFEGENENFTGNDNVIEGSIFIGGETTGSGIQMGGVSSTLPETGGDGATGSGFIRSVQYRGFTSASLDPAHSGWMIYSGSVLPDSGDNYKGVGIEFAGKSGSLRFSTDPSRFEVQADAFFVGRQGLQFISGSDTNIEISSSGYHLTPEGNITASKFLLEGGRITGDVTIEADLTANTISTPAGGPALSEITSQGFARFVSASIGGFDVSTDKINSSNDNLILSSSGEITGSDVKFTGGTIAAFNLSNDALFTNSFFISSSATGEDFFISSSNFQVIAPACVTLNAGDPPVPAVNAND